MVMVTGVVLTSACAQPLSRQIPPSQPGTFNVAMVLPGWHDDQGWSQSHFEGLQYLQQNYMGVHTAYLDNVAEFANNRRLFDALSKRGYQLIIGTSLGYMDDMGVVAEKYADTFYVDVLGVKANGKNYGNLYGAMEEMTYLAGMLAGARAQQDGKPRLGYIGTLPVPEEFRLINATALGMRQTCTDCSMHVRWLNSWNDPLQEARIAEELFDLGVQVLFSGTFTFDFGLVDEKWRKDRWIVTFGRKDTCQQRCLTAPYWQWGPVYVNLVQTIRQGNFKGDAIYFDAKDGGLGLAGFMRGDPPTEGMVDLSPQVIDLVRELLGKMIAGEINYLSIFTGPIKDNKGKIIVNEGQSLTLNDLDQFPPGATQAKCNPCMYWWAEGIVADLPALR